ncbi:MAG TPA: nuclear transport factor 2 family protein [Steroidobacteraceae bacterium]|nr:nuclear transport factor 2 family protein [Steroidobacteraceae bacterium]
MVSSRALRAAIVVLSTCLFSLLLSAATARTAGAASVDQLLLRAQRVADTVEIKRVQCEYGYYLDRSDWDAVLELFTDDVVAEYGNSGLFRGKEHVRGLLYAIGYGKSGLRVGQLRDHIQLQPVIDVAPDGQSARGRWKALVLLGQYGEYARWQTGPYENEYRKEGGRWKISHIHWFETFTVPYEGGWTVAMTQSNVADRKIPPADSPPTFAADPWPAVTLPPYHYPNPATARPAPLRVGSQATGTPGERLAEAVRLAGLVRDEHQIEVLQRTYGYLVDKNLWTQIADLFTDDGTLEIGGRGVFVGKARVLQYLKWLGAPERGKLYDHTQMEPVVTVASDGMTAKGRWRALIFGADLDKRTDFLGDAIYENEYRKENGVWKIAKLHAYFVLYTDFRRGWGVTFWANTTPEVDLPPDRKPSARYEIYPGYTLVPYHYAPGSRWPEAAAGHPEPVPTAQLRSEAAALDKELTRLEDTDAIENLQNAYGFYRDKWQWDEAAKLFAANGTREVAQRGVYVSREHVRRSFDVDGPAGLRQGEVAEHFLYQHVIHVSDDGKTARARVRELTLDGTFGKRAEVGGEVAENTFVKEGGIWKIQSEHQYTTFSADYTKGWSQGFMPIGGPSSAIPADRPPSEVYAAFPEYYVPPFHYENPVSGRRMAR